MNNEKELTDKIKQYQEASKSSPDVDMATLAVKLLEEQHNKNTVPQSQKIWGYLISLFLPPLGLVFAVKFYFMQDRDDGKKIALICAVLTAISIFFTSILIKFVFVSSGVNPAQIQSLNPQEIESLLNN